MSRRALRFDERTVLLVVDVQNDFAHPDGSLYVPGAEHLIEPINELIQTAEHAGAFVAYTQDWHPERTPHFVDQGGKWPKHCVKGSWGAELARGLRVDGPVIQKGSGGEDAYSGFSLRDPETRREQRTALHRLLQERGIERVVVVGLAEDVCVKETALDAQRLGYETTVVERATLPVERGAGKRALRKLEQSGVRIA